MQKAEVLVISNNAGKKYIYFSALTRLGYRCYTAQDIQEAEMHLKLSNKIHLVLYFIPDGPFIHKVSLNELLIKHIKKAKPLFLIGKQSEQHFQDLFNSPDSLKYGVHFLPDTVGIETLIRHIQIINTN
jgi:hypothetical protein